MRLLIYETYLLKNLFIYEPIYLGAYLLPSLFIYSPPYLQGYLFISLLIFEHTNL